MTAKIIDGMAMARGIREHVASRVTAHIKRGKRPPCLAVILVGNDPASEIYVRRKEQTCAAVGIISRATHLATNVTQRELQKRLKQLNEDPEVDGILLQLPLPPHLDRVACVSVISPEKDVDGITPHNEGKLVWHAPGLYPCTPLGIVHLIKSVEPKLSGKVAAVVGRSALVGMPTGTLLENEGCTLIGLHSESIEPQRWTKHADILVVATGVRHLVNRSWVRDGAIVIDVGIHRHGNRLSGDVDFDDVKQVASAITPVPGGVGPMTIAMLVRNSLHTYEANFATK